MVISKEKYLKLFIILSFVVYFIISYSSHAEEIDDNHFYFVQITDTHFGHLDHKERTEKAIDMINNLPMPIKFVVHTGDITMEMLESKDVVDTALSVMNKIKVPVYFVPGNHDILPGKLDPTKKLYIENFGELSSQVEYEDILFIFIYTEPIVLNFEVNGYEPFKHLEKYLKESNGKPVIVFHHTPSANDFYNNEVHTVWPKDAKDRWVKLLNKYNVKAVISGHFHRDEHHWLGNIPLYVSPSIASYWGRQGTFRIYEYHDGKISYRTQYIENDSLKEDYDIGDVNLIVVKAIIKNDEIQIQPSYIKEEKGLFIDWSGKEIICSYVICETDALGSSKKISEIFRGEKVLNSASQNIFIDSELFTKKGYYVIDCTFKTEQGLISAKGYFAY